MLDLKNLEWHLDLIDKTVFDCKIAIKNVQTIQKYIVTGSKVAQQGYFGHYQYQLQFILMVQLSKLFSTKRNQKISFHKLFNKLTQNKVDDDVKEMLSKNHQHKFRSIKDIKSYQVNYGIELAELQAIVDKVETLRDEVFAHSDFRERIGIKVGDVKLLVEFAEKTRNELYSNLLNTNKSLEQTTSWEVDTIIDDIQKKIDFELKELKQNFS